ncbi:MAG: hypothetical protein ACPLW9_00795 [Minisyncoccales bacterium]
MNYEKIPTNKEEAKFETKERTGTEYVFKKFHEVDFEIEKFPELFERLVELSNLPESHFEDAVKMEQIVEILWEDIEKEKINFNLSEIKLTCLFHDIGKSGPVEANKRQRKIIINQMFNTEYFNPQDPKFKNKKIRELTLDEAIEIENFSNKDEIKRYLETLTLHIFYKEKKAIIEEKLDLNKHRLIDLWREHDYWTYQLLKKYGDKDIPQDLIIVASSHHTLEGYDPAMINGDLPAEAINLELLDKYLIVTLIDKYQAWVDRSGKNHEEAIQIIRDNIEQSYQDRIINHEKKMYNQFMKYLQILEKHPEVYNITKSKE